MNLKTAKAMVVFTLAILPVLVWCASDSGTTENASILKGTSTSRYGFYRAMRSHVMGGTRRVFGGRPANLTEFSAACILLDRYWAARCSAAVIAPRWVLTAAHCVSPRVAYVKYNAHRLSAHEGSVVRVLYLYKHPQYKVEEKDEGHGMDVVLLHHDIGLVHVSDDMKLMAKLRTDPLVAMKQYDPNTLKQHELEIMGYGRTDALRAGEELVTVKLLMVDCHRAQWFHCMCGIAGPGRMGDAGVCSGDSGGPVLYRGVQVAVTSMGPLECAVPQTAIPASATSVFTSLYQYAELIDATIHDTDSALRMNKIDSRAVVCRLSDSAFRLILLHLIYNRL